MRTPTLLLLPGMLACALLCGCKSSNHSPDPGTPLTAEQQARFHARVEKMVDEAVERAGLTPEQEARFRPIAKKNFEKRRTVLLSYRDEPRNYFTLRRLRGEMDRINDDAERELREFLDEDQIKELGRFLDEKREAAIAEYQQRRG